MRSRLRLRPQQLYILEAALVGVFFVSALRFLIGMLYSQIGSASITLGLDPAALPTDIPGVVSAGTVQSEVSLLVYMLVLPLLTLLFGRIKWLIVAAVILAAAGRVLMIAGTTITPTTGAAMAVGGGLLYLALMVRHRAQVIPYFFIFGFGIDQIFRAAGNTLDPSWSPNYLNSQAGVSIATVALAIVTILAQGRQE